MSGIIATIPAEGGQLPIEEQSAAVETAPVPEVAAVSEPAQAPVETAQPQTTQTEEVRVPDIPAYDPVTFWQNQAKAAFEESQRYRQQMDQIELSQVPEEEREMFTLKKTVERLQEEREQEQQRAAVQQWRDYCAKYVKSPALQTMSDPLQMVSHTFEEQVTAMRAKEQRISQLQAELNALKGVQNQPAGGPPVTPPGGGTTPTKTLVSMSRKELQELYRLADLGLLKDSDIPPVR